MESNNMDGMNVAECLCEGFIHKTAKNKKLSKDELLTYNAALRFLKAIFDTASDEMYNQTPIIKPNEGEAGAVV